MQELNETLARRVLDTVDAGLVKGLGQPKLGGMCVEAAVCYAMGLPHSDQPSCVGSAVRRYKIRINDAQWSSDAARTSGLRKLAIAQLGSDSIDQALFVRIVVEQTIRQIVPRALRIAKKRNSAHADKLEAAAVRCEQEGSKEAAQHARSTAAADAYAYAADAAAAAADAYAYAADAAAAAAAAASAAAADAAAAYADADDADAAAAYADADAADADAAAAAAAAAAADAADAYAADAYADAAADAAAAAAADADEFLNLACSIALAALIELKSPGCAFLYLTETE